MAPFFQRGVLTTLPQRPSTRSFYFEDFMSLVVDAKLQASTTISVFTCIRYDPLASFEFWPRPIARHLIATLHTNGPFGLAIVKPYVTWRGIGEPTTTRSEIR